MDIRDFNKATVHIGKDKQEMADGAARHFVKVAVDAVEKRGFFSVALSGGSSPPLVYARLLEEDLRKQVPWDKIHYFIGDERCVPDDSPENNFNVARQQLLTKINARPENLHPIVGQDKDPAEAARRYEEEIKKFFASHGPMADDTIPQFDLIWLGMGPDGHCASLFPGTKALTEVSRLVVENFVEKMDAFRITFTFPFINHARSIMFVSNGEDKAAVLSEAITSNVVKYPVQHVVPEHGKVIWYVDAAAAKDLYAVAKK